MKKKALPYAVSLSLLGTSLALPFSVTKAEHTTNQITEKRVQALDNIKNLDASSNNLNFTLSEGNNNVHFDITKIDENNIEVKTITNDTEFHTLTYNKNDNYMLLDGEQIPVIIEEEYNPSLEIQNNVQLAPSPWSPVYVSTYSTTLAKTVTSIGAITTVVGGAISIAALAGVSIATTTIASAIGNWSSAVGLGSLAAGHYLNGKVSWSLYKTSGKVPTGYGSNQTAYRYQNVNLTFKIKNITFKRTFLSQGSWWFANKPY